MLLQVPSVQPQRRPGSSKEAHTLPHLQVRRWRFSMASTSRDVKGVPARVAATSFGSCRACLSIRLSMNAAGATAMPAPRQPNAADTCKKRPLRHAPTIQSWSHVAKLSAFHRSQPRPQLDIGDCMSPMSSKQSGMDAVCACTLATVSCFQQRDKFQRHKIQQITGSPPRPDQSAAQPRYHSV